MSEIKQNDENRRRNPTALVEELELRPLKVDNRNSPRRQPAGFENLDGDHQLIILHHINLANKVVSTNQKYEIMWGRPWRTT